MDITSSRATDLVRVGVKSAALAGLVALLIAAVLARPEMSGAGASSRHIVGNMLVDLRRYDIELWVSHERSLARWTQRSDGTWSDISCEGNALTERYHTEGQPPLDFAVERIYLQSAECMARAMDPVLGTQRRAAEGELREVSRKQVEGRERIVLGRRADDSRWEIQAESGLLVASDLRSDGGSVAITIDYSTDQLVSLPVPAFDEPFTPVSVERYTSLTVEDARRQMSAAGLQLPDDVLGLEPVDAMEYRSKSTDADSAALTVFYRGTTGELQVSLEPEATGPEDVGLDLGVFRAPVGDKSLVILGEDAGVLREAARLIAP